MYMTNLESAIYNRISSKCHAYMKHYLPAEYKLFVAAAEEEYKTHKYRQNSLADIQKALEPLTQNNIKKPAITLTWDPDKEY